MVGDIVVCGKVAMTSRGSGYLPRDWLERERRQVGRRQLEAAGLVSGGSSVLNREINIGNYDVQRTESQQNR